MPAPNQVDIRLLRRVAALLMRADVQAIRLLHVLDPEFRAMRQASSRLDLLRNIEAVASDRSRFIAGSQH
jgi:hypothetical protein